MTAAQQEESKDLSGVKAELGQSQLQIATMRAQLATLMAEKDDAEQRAAVMQAALAASVPLTAVKRPRPAAPLPKLGFVPKQSRADRSKAWERWRDAIVQASNAEGWPDGDAVAYAMEQLDAASKDFLTQCTTAAPSTLNELLEVVGTQFVLPQPRRTRAKALLSAIQGSCGSDPTTYVMKARVAWEAYNKAAGNQVPEDFLLLALTAGPLAKYVEVHEATGLKDGVLAGATTVAELLAALQLIPAPAQTRKQPAANVTEACQDFTEEPASALYGDNTPQLCNACNTTHKRHQCPEQKCFRCGGKGHNQHRCHELCPVCSQKPCKDIANSVRSPCAAELRNRNRSFPRPSSAQAPINP